MDAMENSLAGWLTVSRGKQILQIVAIICTIIMLSVIMPKGQHDLSLIVRTNPADLGPVLGRYLMGNLASSGVEKLKDE